jgi:hypothetical protein
MGVATLLAVASLAVAAVGTAASIEQGNKAAAAAIQTRNIQQAQNTVNQQAQIRDQVRAQRVKTAQIAQASADTGTTGSSGQIGSASVLASQSGSNIGNIEGAAITTTALNKSTQETATAFNKQNMFSQIGQIGTAGFNIFSQTPGFKQTTASIFG